MPTGAASALDELWVTIFNLEQGHGLYGWVDYVATSRIASVCSATFFIQTIPFEKLEMMTISTGIG